MGYIFRDLKYCLPLYRPRYHQFDSQSTTQYQYYFREKAAPLTDKRVKIIHEMVLFIKVIKMYGWELMFKTLVEKVGPRKGGSPKRFSYIM